MKLLLDSHALLWFLAGGEELSAAARSAIEDPNNLKFVSHASVWEIAVKVSLGKLQLGEPFENIFPGFIEANGFLPLITNFRHFQKVLQMPFHHRDPFDRLLIAQAVCEELTIVSRDAHFLAYGAAVLW